MFTGLKMLEQAHGFKPGSNLCKEPGFSSHQDQKNKQSVNKTDAKILCCSSQEEILPTQAAYC